MPTKCFTKATKTGKKYTACVDTKTFKKKGVKGNAKSKKPTAKGVMVVRKKRKIKKRFKTKRLTEMAKKSTITPPLTLSRRRPDGYKQEGQKKMSAGMSVLMTSGLMNRVGGFRKGGKNVITPKQVKDFFNNKSNSNELDDKFAEEVIYPAEDNANEDYNRGDLKLKILHKKKRYVVKTEDIGELQDRLGKSYDYLMDNVDSFQDYGVKNKERKRMIKEFKGGILQDAKAGNISYNFGDTFSLKDHIHGELEGQASSMMDEINMTPQWRD